LKAEFLLIGVNEKEAGKGRALAEWLLSTVRKYNKGKLKYFISVLLIGWISFNMYVSKKYEDDAYICVCTCDLLLLLPFIRICNVC